MDIANPAEQLHVEQQLLSKADSDIEQGWTRLRDQEDLLSWLQATGRDTREAKRLLQLMKSTLIEWERHRGLIEQRVAYLQRQLSLLD
jgi:hypothetical protein